MGPTPCRHGLVSALTGKKRGDTVAAIYPQVQTLLNSQVLVLNRLWQAVNICSARRAFTLLYQGHAQVGSSDPANNFLTHDFDSWRDFSATAPDHEVVTTIWALEGDTTQLHQVLLNL